MEAVFEKLKTLQGILSRKFELEREIVDIPKALTTKTEVLNRSKMYFIEKNELDREKKEKLKFLQMELVDAKAAKENYEKTMDVIKTQKEYETLEKEIRDATEKEQNIRKDIQKLEREIQELSIVLEQQEKQIELGEEELRQEMEKIESESAEKKKDLDQLSKQESEVTPGMDVEVLFKFERIIQSKSGRGIVGIKNGTCTGCHMILPKQFVNTVRQADSIQFCPYCSRILFFESEADPERTYGDSATGGLADLMDDDGPGMAGSLSDLVDED